MDSSTLAVTDSRLLALAPELLCTIFDSLNNETLPILRLTCKTLELISFDRFVKAFFSRRACHVYDPDRWLLLSRILNGPARLTSRIDEIVFTDSMLEFNSFRAINTVITETVFIREKGHFAQTHEQEVMEYAAVQREESARKLGYSTFPSPSLVNRVMMQISTRAPRAHICFDFTWTPALEYRGNHMHDSLFLAAATSQLTIDTLLLDSASLLAMKDTILHLGGHFQRCISSLRRLTYEHRWVELRRAPRVGEDHRLMVFNDIVHNAPGLCELELDISYWEEHSVPRLQARNISKTLLSHEMFKLRILDLCNMEILASDLANTLSRCTLLEKVALHGIDLDTAWSRPLRQMLALSKLSCIQLQELKSAVVPENGKFLLLKLDGLDNWPVWGKKDDGICIDDRAAMQATLQQLVRGPLLYDLNFDDQ